MVRRCLAAHTLCLVAATTTAAVLAIAALSPAPPAALASRLSGIQAAGISGLQVLNLDTAQSATVVVDFYKQGGGPPVPINRPNVGPGSAANIYPPQEAFLSNGAYAAIVSSDRDVRAIARTDWGTSGGAAMYEESIPTSDALVVPAMKRHDGQTSLVTIQNTDMGQPASVSVEFLVRGNPQPAVTMDLSVAPGTSSTIDLYKHASFATIPPGAVGHLRIRSATPVAVTALVDVETSQRGVYAFQGIPAEMAARRLLAPVIHAAAPLDPGDPSSPPLDTRIEIASVFATAPVSVTVRYQGVSGTCVGQSFAEPSFAIAAGDSATVSQAPAQGVLPAGCTAAATIDAVGGLIAATVIDAREGGILAAAYNAQHEAMAGTRVYAPHWRHSHTPARFSTALQVMNAGTAPTTATLSIVMPITGRLADCGADCTAVIPPGGAHLWWPPSIAAHPGGTYGSATVDADQPLVAIVTDVSVTGATDLASYVAIAAGEPVAPPPGTTPAPGGTPVPSATPTPAPMQFGPRFVPLLLVQVQQRPPIDTPTARLPTETPFPTITPFPTETPNGTPSATDTPGTPATPTPPIPTRPPFPTDTPSPTAVGGGTAVPTATPVGGPQETSTPAPTTTSPPPTNTSLPTTQPPSATPPAAGGGARVSPIVRRRVPPAAINEAMAHPERIAGWGKPANPNKPVGPDNPLRTCLGLRNPNQPYHPIFNSLVFKAYCP